MAFQNVIGNRLTQREATTSYEVAYTVPPNIRTYVKDITVCNTTSSAIGVYVSLVPSGDSASATNAVFYNASLPAYSTMQWTGTAIMTAADTIQIKGSAAGCTVSISGGEAS